jgi:hypothetical protein
LWFVLVLLGILAKVKVYPTYAERALAPVSPSSCGIGSIINSFSITSKLTTCSFLAKPKPANPDEFKGYKMIVRCCFVKYSDMLF